MRKVSPYRSSIQRYPGWNRKESFGLGGKKKKYIQSWGEKGWEPRRVAKRCSLPFSPQFYADRLKERDWDLGSPNDYRKGLQESSKEASPQWRWGLGWAGNKSTTNSLALPPYKVKVALKHEVKDSVIDGIISSLFSLSPHFAMAWLKMEYTSLPTVFDLGHVTRFCQWNVSGHSRPNSIGGFKCVCVVWLASLQTCPPSWEEHVPGEAPRAELSQTWAQPSHICWVHSPVTKVRVYIVTNYCDCEVVCFAALSQQTLTNIDPSVSSFGFTMYPWSENSKAV